LRPAALEEGFLHGVELSAIGDAFNRPDLAALDLKGRHKTTVRYLAVNRNCAGAAFPLATTFLGAGEMQPLAQHVDQPRHRVGLEAMFLPVHRAGDGDFLYSIRHARSPRWRIGHP